MDRYTRKCVEYLREHDPSLLQRYLNRCGGLDIQPVEGTKVREESIFSCLKCGKNDVSFIEKQLRSADEGASIYFRCNSCGHNWANL
jgi:DNA-directed RNA polymerase subunit M/transcription elongation factor TFIIS